MMWLMLVCSVLPALGIMYYVYREDYYEKEPFSWLFISFLLGIASVAPAYLGSYIGDQLGLSDSSGNWVETLIFAFGVVALTEELAKWLFLRFAIYPRKVFNEPYDGIVYAVMIGMGFATFENVVYTLQYQDWETVIGRMLTAVPAHAAFGVLMGYYMGLAKFAPNYKLPIMLVGLLAAILLHGAYDFFLMQENWPGLTFLAFVVLFFGLRYSRRAMALHQGRSPFKNQA